jgi:selenocysteine lyase/cysteine desulfurase
MPHNTYHQHFADFGERIWLNTASEGAIPLVAAEALKEACEWKLHPYELTLRRFREVPERLKINLSRLLNVYPTDVILGNSATYGIHLLANGLPFQAEDEILVMQNDFPTNILPWLALEEKGVRIRQMVSENSVISPTELYAYITKRTKVVCLSHVHSFTGHMLDIAAIGHYCRQRQIIFVVNISQSCGNIPLNLTELPVDAVTCAAFKWLCGPYGTGFCWMTSSLRERLDYNQASWGLLTAEELAGTGPLKPILSKEARRYDVYGTANFFNFYPLAKAVELLLEIGVSQICQHNQQLVQMFLEKLDRSCYEILSPLAPLPLTSLMVISHKDPQRNPGIFRILLEQGIYSALWKGKIRFSPHLYNRQSDIVKTLDIIHREGKL